MLDGLPVHADGEALVQPAAPALIPVGLVHLAASTPSSSSSSSPGLAGVLPAPPDGPLEEPGAPVAREDPVVLPRAEVAAHAARRVVEDAAAAGGR